jgi:hypothetical protein
MTVAILFCEISKTRKDGKDERGEASEEEEEKKRRSLKEDDAPYYILDLIHSSLDLKRARSLDKETKRFIA